MTTKKNIFEEHLTEWLKAKGNRKKRGEMIKYISQTIKINPRSVGRSFKRRQMNKVGGTKKNGRPIYYTADVNSAIKDVWETASCPCGELLHPVIADYVNGYKQEGRWNHSPEATRKLLEMSEGTVKNKTHALRKKYNTLRGKSSTKPSALKSIIPIFKGPWDDLLPGNTQIDTVAHCGDTLAGDFVYSLSIVDYATYWGIRRAQWNKGAAATKDNMAVVKERLPFPWLMGHPDTGSEFINWVAKDWFDTNGINYTRSEPYKKNDNMCVEERNGHVIRKYLGYQRIDVGREIVDIINRYYETLDLYLNHFQTVKRTLSKERVGAKYVRTFEKKARTPYYRLMSNENITQEIKDKVKKEHESLNPLLLKEKLGRIHKEIFNLQKMGNQRTD